MRETRRGRGRGRVWLVLVLGVAFLGYVRAQCGAGTYEVATSTFTSTAATRTYTLSGVKYAVFEFTNTAATSSIQFTSAVTADILVVGGGGGGCGGGGGGGGVLIENSVSLSSGTYTVTVGSGGAGCDRTTWLTSLFAGHGTASSITATGFSKTARGGGGGGLAGNSDYAIGVSVASAGGNGFDSDTYGITATKYNGFAGGRGARNGWGSSGGGGGAGQAGSNGYNDAQTPAKYADPGPSSVQRLTCGGAGGDGLQNNFASGTNAYYGGGGGGAIHTNQDSCLSTASPGGRGGGGGGATAPSTCGTAGTANTGGGSGGCEVDFSNGANALNWGTAAVGGSGIVVIRVAICSSCDAGKFSLGGATACTNCPAGSYRTTTGGAALSDCTACAAGKYGGTAGQSSEADACPNSCAANLWSAPGSSSSSACVGCAPVSGSQISAGGGTMTTDVPGYNVHQYLATGGATTTTSVTFSRDVVADVLIIGGGGAGGRCGGGGGAGAAIYYGGYKFVQGVSYSFTVGGGGTGSNAKPGGGGGSGSDSTILSVSPASTIFTARGGGGGGQGQTDGSSGGCGGGGGADWDGSATTGGTKMSTNILSTISSYTLGFDGGNGFQKATADGQQGGGGGGMSAAGAAGTDSQASNGGVGGDGISSVSWAGLTLSLAAQFGSAYTSVAQLNSASYFVAGGGGAGGHEITASQIKVNAGGKGGGGAGNSARSTSVTCAPVAGSVNTGGGGGGGCCDSAGGAGGSGLILLRYSVCQPCGAGTRLQDAGASGTCTACMSGTYSGPGQSACSSCPADSGSPVAADKCYANAGKYPNFALTGTQSSEVINLARSCDASGNSGGTTACPTALRSQYGSVANDGPAFGNDGIIKDATPGFVTVDHGTNNWWRVDLGSVQKISGGKIVNTVNCCYTRLDNFKIWIGTSTTYDGTGNFNCYSHTGLAHRSAPYTVYFQCVGSGRYVFLHQPLTASSDYLSFNELEVYPLITTTVSSSQVLVVNNDFVSDSFWGLSGSVSIVFPQWMHPSVLLGSPQIPPAISDNDYPVVTATDGAVVKPLAWYKFDTGACLSDSSGNGYTMIDLSTINSAYGVVTCTTANVKRGTSSSLLVRPTSGTLYMTLRIPTSSFTTSIRNVQVNSGLTITFWARCTSSNLGNMRLISWNVNTAIDGTHTSEMLISANSATGNLNFQIYDPAASPTSVSFATTATYFDNNWHFYTWSFSMSGDWTISIDNTKLVCPSADGCTTSKTRSIPDVVSGRDYYYLLGKEPSACPTCGTGVGGTRQSFLDGNYDDFRIYRGVLTDAQVTTLYQGRVGVYDAGFADCPDSATTCSGSTPSKHCDKFGGGVCCGAGMYMLDGSDSACQNCPAGTYSTDGAGTACTLCAAGKYTSASGMTAASDCSDCKSSGSYTTTCTPGTFARCTGTATNVCCGGTPEEYFIEGTSTVCQTCASGKYGDGSGTSCTDTADCAAGTYGSVGSCTNCPAGKYRGTTGATALSDCADCTSGTDFAPPPGGATACSACSAACPSNGQYITTACTTSADIVCVACTNRDSDALSKKYTGKATLAQGDACPYDCVAGAFLSGGTCSQCAAGKYQTETGGFAGAACSDCAAGKYSATVQATAAEVCLDCAAGSYSASAAQSECALCAAGKASAATGASTAGSCEDCAAGTYTSAAGQATCVGCAGSTFQAEQGKTACDACSGACPDGQGRTAACSASADRTCSACITTDDQWSAWTGPGESVTTCPYSCNAGYYKASADTGACTGCGTGKYQATTGYTGLTCTDCVAGKSSAGTARTAAATCVDCVRGSYSLTAASAACTGCARGKYSDVLGASSATVCTDCARGTISAADGASVCTSCTAGTNFAATTGLSACTGCGGACTGNTYRSSPCAADADRVCTGCTNLNVLGVAYTGTSTVDLKSFCPYSCIKGARQAKLSDGAVLDSAANWARKCGAGENEACNHWVSPAGVSVDRVVDGVRTVAFTSGSGTDPHVMVNLGTSRTIHGGAAWSTTWNDFSGFKIYAGTSNGGHEAAGNQLCFDSSLFDYSTVFAENSFLAFECSAAISAQYVYFVRIGAGLQITLNELEVYSYTSGVTDATLVGCKSCSAGLYQATSAFTGSVCTNCVVGTFNPITGATAAADCKSCGKGTYNAQVAQSACALCGTNSYNTAVGSTSADACTSCGANAVSGALGATSADTCSTCAVGRYISGTACLACSAGQFQDVAGLTFCKTCTTGTYMTGTGAPACTKCAKGKASASTGAVAEAACVLCLAGSYTSADGQSACLSCAEGTHTVEPASSGSSYDASQNLARACGDGQSACLTQTSSGNEWTTDDSSNPIWISHSYANDGQLGQEVQTFPDNDSWWALDLGASKQIKFARVYFLQPIYYYPFEVIVGNGATYSAPGNSACFTVTDVAATPPTSSSPNLYYEFTCDAQGRYLFVRNTDGVSQLFLVEVQVFPPDSASQTSYTACTSCVAGTYGTIAGQASYSAACVQCLAGTYSVTAAATLASTCVPCPTGTYGTGLGADALAKCTKCAKGTFQSASGQQDVSACTACGSGKFTNDDGLSVCSNCALGKFSAGSVSACSDCVAGTYASATGLATCPLCAKGKYSAVSAATTADACSGCAAGTYGTVEGETTAAAACVGCDPGRFTATAGLTVCAYCSAGSIATASGKASCELCAAGRYFTGTGGSLCDLCAAGKYFTGTGAADPARCDSCGTGKYSEASGAVSDGTCAQCLAGKYNAATGQSACTNCGRDKYSAALGAISEATCASCPDGTFSAAEGATSAEVCNTCPAGNSLVAGVCSTCTAGKFQDLNGQSSCKLCGAGKYMTGTGAVQCDGCGVGKYSEAEGAVSDGVCTDCPAGRFGAATGLSACLLCGTGTFQVDQGATACSSCQAGKFLATSGASLASACDDCADGSFSPAGGASACRTCPDGLTTGGNTGSSSVTACVCTDPDKRMEGGSETCKYINCGAGTYFLDFSGPNELRSCAGGACPARSEEKLANAWSAGGDGGNDGALDTADNGWDQAALAVRTRVKDVLSWQVDFGRSVQLASGSLWPRQQVLVTHSLSTATAWEPETGLVEVWVGDYPDAPDAAGNTKCYTTGAISDYDNGAVPGRADFACSATGRYAYVKFASDHATRKFAEVALKSSDGTNQCRSCAAGACPARFLDLQSYSWTAAGNAGNDGEINAESNEWNTDYVFQQMTSSASMVSLVWSADMGSSKAIVAGRVWADQVCDSTLSQVTQICTGWLQGFEVWAGNDGRTYNGPGNAMCYKEPSTTRFTSSMTLFKFPCAMSGRYVHLVKATTSSLRTLQFAEIALHSASQPSASSVTFVDRANVCAQCSKGTYSSQSGLTADAQCSKCGTGTYQSSLGATTSAACLNCPVGRYQSSQGATVCSLCAAGTYGTGTGAQSDEACSLCPEGTYQTVLGVTAQSNCKSCGVGKYSTASGLSSESLCSLCVPGTYGATAGLTAASNCLDCSAGQFSSASGSTACEYCAAGSYSDGTRFSSCTTCPSGKWSAAGSASAAACTGCVFSPGTKLSKDGAVDAARLEDVPGHYVHSFLSGTVTVTFSETTTADVLVVGGGGAGSFATGGGGGAGALIFYTGYVFNAGTSYTFQVGAGGSGRFGQIGDSGEDTFIADNATHVFLAKGGGAGGGNGEGNCQANLAVSGGSGGGSASCLSNFVANSQRSGSAEATNVVAGQSGQVSGHAGGEGNVVTPVSASNQGGGGGGAGSPGSAGSAGGTGGNGVHSVLSGESQASLEALFGQSYRDSAVQESDGKRYVAAGGGGGGYEVFDAAVKLVEGGLGGGGKGVDGFGVNGYHGAANTGSGGGGCLNTDSGSGGSGLILLRYALCQPCPAGKFLAVGGDTACGSCGVGTFSTGVGVSTDAVCSDCAAGAYSSAAASSACALCAAGTYQPNVRQDDASDCAGCGAGKYSTAQGLADSAGCQLCAADTYSTAPALDAASKCVACAADSSSAEGSGTQSSCVCDPGFSGPNGGPCDLCGPTQYCSQGTAYSCPQFSQANRSGASALEDCLCNAGYYGYALISGTPCAYCPPHYYCPGGAVNLIQQCPHGKLAAAGSSASSACVCPDNAESGPGAYNESACTCKPGFKRVEDASVDLFGWRCDACATGEICRGGRVSSCPANSQPPPGTITSIFDCTCLPGFNNAPVQTEDDFCRACEADRYCLGGNHSAPCPAGAQQRSPPGSYSADFCLCLNGTYGIGTATCQPCSPGKFCVLGMQQDCPQNMNSPAGADTVANCSCNAGYWGDNGGSCVACPAGTYNLIQGCHSCQTKVSSDCLSCPVGTYSAAEARNSTCDSCSPGKYQDLERQASESSCKPCGTGRYSTATGATAQGQCLLCARGRYQANAVATAAASCLECSAGSYQSASGQASCPLCAAGTFSAASRATACSSCKSCHADAAQTVACAEGSSADASVCECKAGFFGTGLACAACKSCHAEAVQTASCAQNSASDVAACECKAGFFGTGLACSACRSCHADATQTASCAQNSATDVAACACNAGFFGDGAQCQACTSCGANSRQTGGCLAGSTDNAVSCTCNAGYFSPSGQDCAACPEGTWGPGGPACESCGRGRFSSGFAQVSAAVCQPCPLNTYGPRAASGNQSFACLACPAQSETVGEGSVNRTQCVCAAGLVGVVTESGGACSGCEPNFYASRDRLSCLACPANTQSPGGSTEVWHCTSVAGYYVRHTKTVKLQIEVPEEDADPDVLEAYVRAAINAGDDVQVKVEL